MPRGEKRGVLSPLTLAYGRPGGQNKIVKKAFEYYDKMIRDPKRIELKKEMIDLAYRNLRELERTYKVVETHRYTRTLLLDEFIGYPKYPELVAEGLKQYMEKKGVPIRDKGEFLEEFVTKIKSLYGKKPFAVWWHEGEKVAIDYRFNLPGGGIINMSEVLEEIEGLLGMNILNEDQEFITRLPPDCCGQGGGKRKKKSKKRTKKRTQINRRTKKRTKKRTQINRRTKKRTQINRRTKKRTQINRRTKKKTQINRRTKKKTQINRITKKNKKIKAGYKKTNPYPNLY